MRISAAQMNGERELELAVASETVWFGPRCCVVRRGASRDVLVGGILVATFGPKDTAMRNLLLVGLAEEPDVHLGELARGFGLSPEAVRQIRRLYEAKGVPALLERKRGGGKVRRTAVEKRARKLFDAGHTVDEVHAAVKKVSRSTVMNIRKDWAREKAERDTPKLEQPRASLAPPSASPPFGAAPVRSTGQVDAPAPEAGVSDSGVEASAMDERLRDRAPQSAALVQHAGSWLLIAMVHALGLHQRAFVTAAATAEKVSEKALRLALDAVVVALALGERCVEGVRRVATGTAAALLLASSAPSPTWVRRTLGRFSEDNGAGLFHLAMAREYVEAARRAAREGPVFYADNHLRPYSGKYDIRWGWRMQDKRAQPGITDYYLHDEDGRPVGHFAVPEHGSLTDFLSPIARLLRLALPEENSLIAFDRAGAFPSQMAELRDEGFEFVTYERRPYALLSESEFTETVIIDSERLKLCESRKNLGGGRGRVRRICVRTEEGRQINLLAVSKRSARRLVEVMRGRWNQENGFKHGNERWGINQLDGRTVTPYEPDTIIPNPARRRLDDALRIARVREGLARSALARMPKSSERREELEREIVEAMAEQKKLEAQRPSAPTHAPLKDTELANTLVQHKQGYKLVIDTIRIACANAESELAAALGPQLPRGEEAKKALANIFAAPGRVKVGAKFITVTLQPAGTRAELTAFETFLRHVNALRLRLPGDQEQRPLRFSLAQVS